MRMFRGFAATTLCLLGGIIAVPGAAAQQACPQTQPVPEAQVSRAAALRPAATLALLDAWDLLPSLRLDEFERNTRVLLATLLARQQARSWPDIRRAVDDFERDTVDQPEARAELAGARAAAGAAVDVRLLHVDAAKLRLLIGAAGSLIDDELRRLPAGARGAEVSLRDAIERAVLRLEAHRHRLARLALVRERAEQSEGLLPPAILGRVRSALDVAAQGISAQAPSAAAISQGECAAREVEATLLAIPRAEIATAVAAQSERLRRLAVTRFGSLSAGLMLEAVVTDPQTPFQAAADGTRRRTVDLRLDLLRVPLAGGSRTDSDSTERHPLGYVLRDVTQTEEPNRLQAGLTGAIDRLDQDRLRATLVALDFPMLIGAAASPEIVLGGGLGANALTIDIVLRLPLPRGGTFDDRMRIFGPPPAGPSALDARIAASAGRLGRALRDDALAMIEQRIGPIRDRADVPMTWLPGLAVGSGGLRMPIDVPLGGLPGGHARLVFDLRYADGRFSLTASAEQGLGEVGARVAAAAVAQLRVGLNMGGLVQAQVQETERLLSDWVTVERVRIAEPLSAGSIAVVDLRVGLPGRPVRATIPVTVSRDRLDLDTASLRSALQALVSERVAELRIAAARALTAEVLAWFREREGRQVAALGLSATLRRVTPRADGVQFCLEAAEAGVALSGLTVTGAGRSGDRLLAPRFDWSGVRLLQGNCASGVEASPQVLAARWLGLPPGRIRGVSLDWRGDGAVLAASLDAGEFGDIPLGTLAIGWSTTRVAAADLRGIIAGRLRDRLYGLGRLGDLGPIEDLSIGPGADPSNPWTLSIRGKAPLWKGLRADVVVPIDLAIPRMDRPEIRPPDRDQIARALFGEALSAIRPAGLEVMPLVEPGRPLAIAVSGPLPAPYLDRCTLQLTRLVISANGLRGSGEIEGRCAGIPAVPIPGTGTALVNPRLSLDLAHPTRIGIGADLTLDMQEPGATREASRAMKFESRLVLDISRASAELLGTLTLAERARLFEAEARLDLNRLGFNYTSRSTGVLDRLVQFSNQGEVNGAERYLSTSSSIGVLGLRLSESGFRVNLAGEPRASWTGNANVVLGAASWQLQSGVDLAHFDATGDIRFGIGRWEALKGDFHLTAAAARLGFNVLGLRIVAQQSRVDRITPDYLLELLRSILRPELDLESFRRWLREPRIEIRPITRGSPSERVQPAGPQARSFGSGDPVVAAPTERPLLQRQTQAGTGTPQPSTGAPQPVTGPSQPVTGPSQAGTGAPQQPGPAGTPPEAGTIWIGDEAEGTRRAVRLTPDAERLFRSGALQALQPIQVRPGSIAPWWRQDCTGDGSSGADPHAYNLFYAVRAESDVQAGDLVLLRLSGCGAQARRRGYLILPYGIDHFLLPSGGAGRREELDRQQTASARWGVIPPGARRLLRELAERAPADAGMEGERGSRPRGEDWPVQIRIPFPQDAQRAYLVAQRDVGGVVELAAAAGKSMRIPAASELGRLLGAGREDLLGRIVGQHAGQRLAAALLIRGPDGSERIQAGTLMPLEAVAAAHGPGRLSTLRLPSGTRESLTSLAVQSRSCQPSPRGFVCDDGGLRFALILNLSDAMWVDAEPIGDMAAEDAFAAALRHAAGSARGGAVAGGWVNEQNPMLRVLVDALHRAGQPRLIAVSDDRAPPAQVMLGGDGWAAIYDRNGRRLGPSSIETGLLVTRDRTASLLPGRMPERPPGSPVIRHPDVAARVLGVLAQAEAGASLWIVGDPRPGEAASGLRAVVGHGAGSEWGLDIVTESGDRAQAWTVDAPALATAWLAERASCAPLAAIIPPVDFARAAGGQLGDMRPDQRHAVRRAAERPLLAWVTDSRPRSAGCSQAWGFVLLHGSLRSTP